MKRFGIFGSGFGLYGYLPALINGCFANVVLPKRYFGTVSCRPELSSYINLIDWKKEEGDVLKSIDGAVVALRPFDQNTCILSSLLPSKIHYLLLEKPLAPSPNLAQATFKKLVDSKKNFRIGYNFRYTDWGKKFIQELPSTNYKGQVRIIWNFLAHHYANDLLNWKRFHTAGGGVLRFYGIHIIALLAETGYQDVIDSHMHGELEDAPEKWRATFSGSALPKCEVQIDTRSCWNSFCIEYDSKETNRGYTIFTRKNDPFEIKTQPETKEGHDFRVPILIELFRSLFGEEAGKYDWYEATIHLWGLVEQKTAFCLKKPV